MRITPGQQRQKLARALARLTRPSRQEYEDLLARGYLHDARRFVERRLPHQTARDYLAAVSGHARAEESHQLIHRMTTEPDRPPRHRRFSVALRPEAPQIAGAEAR